MILGFGRRLLREIAFCVVIISIVLALKQNYPQFGKKVGQWIAGEEDSSVVQAVSAIINHLSDGESIKTAVEVFCEHFEISAQD